MGDASQALEGITVFDIGGTAATAYCGKLFADYGADVVLVEPPGTGFDTRRLAPLIPGLGGPEASAMHAYLSTNKRSIELDLNTPADVDQFLDLAKDCSLVIDAASSRDRQVPPERLGEVAPNGVLLSITWFGLDGLYADFAGGDGVCQALTGQLYPIGTPGEPPVLPGGYQAQIVAGLTAYVAALGQILAREIGNANGPAHLDVSIFESNLCFTELGGIRGFNGEATKQRMGVNRFPPTYPMGVYPCRDGWLGVTALTPSQWGSFCELLGIGVIADKPKYQTTLGRLEDADKIEALILDAVRNESAEDLFHRGQQMRIPLAPVPTMEQLFDVDQYVERESFSPVQHPDGIEFEAPVTPFRLFRTPAVAGGASPRLGQDSESLLKAAREVQL